MVPCETTDEEVSEFLVNVILKGYQNKINYLPNHAYSMYS